MIEAVDGFGHFPAAAQETFLQVFLRQENREFVSADAVAETFFSEGIQDGVGHGTDEAVADCMSETVVHALQVVGIELADHDGFQRPVRDGLLQFGFFFNKGGTVADSGQRVGIGNLPDCGGFGCKTELPEKKHGRTDEKQKEEEKQSDPQEISGIVDAGAGEAVAEKIHDTENRKDKESGKDEDIGIRDMIFSAGDFIGNEHPDDHDDISEEAGMDERKTFMEIQDAQSVQQGTRGKIAEGDRQGNPGEYFVRPGHQGIDELDGRIAHENQEHVIEAMDKGKLPGHHLGNQGFFQKRPGADTHGEKGKGTEIVGSQFASSERKGKNQRDEAEDDDNQAQHEGQEMGLHEPLIISTGIADFHHIKKAVVVVVDRLCRNRYGFSGHAGRNGNLVESASVGTASDDPDAWMEVVDGLPVQGNREIDILAPETEVRIFRNGIRKCTLQNDSLPFFGNETAEGTQTDFFPAVR